MFALPNLGSIDRLVRLAVGAALITAPFLTAMAPLEVAAVGAVLVFTGLMRCCPVYRLFGANTCKLD